LIKINLLKGLKEITAPVSTPSGGFSLDWSLDLGVFKPFAPILHRVFVPALMVYGAWVGLDAFKASRLEALSQQKAQFQADVELVRKQLAKQSDFDKLKQQLDEDERVIQTKLTTIKVLIEDRKGSVHALLSLLAALPDEVWLENCTLDKKQLSLTGFSFEFGHISELIQNIGKNMLFKEAQLVSSREEGSSESDKQVRFELKVERSNHELGNST
jgi:Tfp pilus assembly protein PilN